MGASKLNSGLISLDRLPRLPPDARARVLAAVLHAIEALIKDLRTACKQFIATTAEPKNAGHSRVVERPIAMKAFQRAFRDAEIRSSRALFDVVAAEYLNIDTDPEAYSERLRQVVVRYVLRELPIRQDERFIVATILMAVADWEGRRSVGPTDPEQYPTTSARETPANMIDRLRKQNGWTMEDLAEHAGLDTKQIYKIKNGGTVNTTTIVKAATALECDPGALMPLTTLNSQH